jgi:hypothetical protein
MSKKHDIRLPYEKCMDMTVRELRKTREYKLLTPLGKLNASGTYKYGNKSRMRKVDLCKALDNPKEYHRKNKELKKKMENAGNRVRKTRKGQCPKNRRPNPECPLSHKHEGLTTTGNTCCYKKKQSRKVINKRKN